MKKLIYNEILKMVDSGELRFGFDYRITDFVLESFKEDGDKIICETSYIEKGKMHKKYIHLNP